MGFIKYFGIMDKDSPLLRRLIDALPTLHFKSRLYKRYLNCEVCVVDIGGVDVQHDVLGVELQFIVPGCVRVYSPQSPARKPEKKRVSIRYATYIMYLIHRTSDCSV